MGFIFLRNTLGLCPGRRRPYTCAISDPRKQLCFLLSPSALPLRDYPLAAGAAMPSFLSPSHGRAAGAGVRGEERGTWESGLRGRLGEC